MSRKGFAPILIFGIVAIIIIVGAIGYLALKSPSTPPSSVQNQQSIPAQTISNASNTNVASSTPIPIASTFLGPAVKLVVSSTTYIANWQKPTSNKRGYPFVAYVSSTDASAGNDSQLRIYSFDTKTSRAVDVSVPEGGASGLGSQSPVVSPDFLYTAYMKGADLHLVSNDTLENKIVASASEGNDIYIGGWSADSQKLVFAISVTPSMGFIEKAQAAGGGFDIGLYLVDLKSGLIEKLPFDFGIDSFIDARRILVLQGDGKPLGVYDTDTQEMRKFITSPQGTYTEQFDFSPDGTKWVFLNDTSIIYANFPSFSGTTIDTGAFARIQWPLLSPDGNLIAYENYPSIAVFNLKDGTKKSFSALGITDAPQAWIDNNQLIVFRQIMTDHGGSHFLQIIHIDTGQMEDLK